MELGKTNTKWIKYFHEKCLIYLAYHRLETVIIHIVFYKLTEKEKTVFFLIGFMVG